MINEVLTPKERHTRDLIVDRLAADVIRLRERNELLETVATEARAYCIGLDKGRVVFARHMEEALAALDKQP